MRFLIKRLVLFREIPAVLLSTEFIERQFNGITKMNCVQRCRFDKNCMTIAFGLQYCVLYTTDHSTLTMLVVANDDCYNGNIQAYTNSDVIKCGWGKKVTDSVCSDWSNWEAVVDQPCGGNASFTVARNRSRKCTPPLFGGQPCDGLAFESQTKFPDILPNVSTLGFSNAKSICQNNNKALFTGLERNIQADIVDLTLIVKRQFVCIRRQFVTSDKH